MAERDHVAGVARANLERGVGIGHVARLVALGVAGKQLAVIQRSPRNHIRDPGLCWLTAPGRPHQGRPDLLMRRGRRGRPAGRP